MSVRLSRPHSTLSTVHMRAHTQCVYTYMWRSEDGGRLPEEAVGRTLRDIHPKARQRNTDRGYKLQGKTQQNRGHRAFIEHMPTR